MRAAFASSYEPVLRVLEKHNLAVSLHYSGALLEWFAGFPDDAVIRARAQAPHDRRAHPRPVSPRRIERDQPGRHARAPRERADGFSGRIRQADGRAEEGVVYLFPLDRATARAQAR